MTINHLNLPVSNVAGAITFFESHFDFKCLETKGDNMIAVLRNPADFTLVLMSSKMNKNANTAYPDAFHIGFILDSAEKVNDTFSKLKAGGIQLEREPQKIRDSFGFYFYFDELFIEVAHYLD
ncbi:VOC family protein [Chitinophaga sp. CF418]|uniref:VOC family protein n=1 Tax=Chitinophaga sp. CF418 TaxID=1855287 RepID=UPI000921656A|nr:VOC family protein [Chitinophaga sp. CF418]SHN42465.1 Glyoxalase/Bleomycin resistance protein/Dioxygenase superfamily protein [Chitinophaga sp. CF418]